MNPMNQEMKVKWVAALRSGKYKQGSHVLRQTGMGGSSDREDCLWCCLGVLCDLIEAEGQGQWVQRGGSYRFRYHGNGLKEEACGLLAAICEDLDIQHWNASIPVKPGEKLNLMGRTWPTIDESSEYYCQFSSCNLAELNDLGMNFGAIAKIIEERF